MLLFLSTTIEEKERLMIETYFFRTPTINRLRGGPLGSDLDDLATALQQQGYAWDSIRGYLRGCDQFARWLLQQEYAVADVKPTVCLGVTYAVVCTYRCDDGRIEPP